ncbi:MAG: hypothetical protein V1873_03900 [Verrucomicrobiota bacterium]
MSAVSEWIVREYFESLGFLVRQPRKYQVAARAKQVAEEIDLLVLNPAVAEHQVPEALVWGAAELKHISRAIIGVRGWHTERFSPAVIGLSPEIFRFAETTAVKNVAREFGPGPIAKVLCLPDLPSAGPLKDKALGLFKEGGIDGVILFRTMLLELAAHVDINRNYEKSDLLQILRLLKNYDLLKGPQMDLFTKKRRKKVQD